MKPETWPPAVKVGRWGATAFSVYGSGPPVVLVHGVGMAQSVWRPQVEHLSGRFTVITYDLLGHGASDLPAEGVTLRHYADQLRDLLDALEVASVHIVGHSMGALVALEFALNYPARTRRVVAMNAVFKRSPEQRAAVIERARALQSKGMDHNISQTMSRWFGDPVPESLQLQAAKVEALLLNVDPIGYARTYALFATSDDAHVERLNALQAPTLFFTGEGDTNSSPAMSEELARLTPHGQLQVLAGARHMMGVTHPQDVATSIEDFLQG